MAEPSGPADRNADRGTLAVLAGSGEVPRRAIEAARAQGRRVFVVAFEGHTEPATAALGDAHVWSRLGAAGEIIKALRAHDVKELVLAGPVRRPTIAELRPDWTAARFLARIGAKAFSDDGLLGSVVRMLEEEEGFRVIGVDDLVAGLLAGPGPFGKHSPDAEAEADIARGVEVVRTLGALDVGQSAVVQQGVVLGVEAAEGTDALLRRAGELRLPGRGGVLVKLMKPQQERRVDLPTIGRGTVEGAAAAGLAGIAVEAGATLVMDRAAVAAAADSAGLFVVGLVLAP